MNFIGKVGRDGRVLDSPPEIKDEVARFFEDLYKGENFNRPKLDGVSFPMIPLEVKN